MAKSIEMPPRLTDGRTLQAILHYDRADLDLVSRYEVVVDGYNISRMSDSQIFDVFGNQLDVDRMRQVVQQFIDAMEGRLV